MAQRGHGLQGGRQIEFENEKTRHQWRVFTYSTDGEGELAPAFSNATRSFLPVSELKSQFENAIRTAEHHPLTFTPDELRELPNVISAPRFATYLRASNNDKAAALSLYVWNLRVSAAFMYPLQICEISVRNGVVQVIEEVHGPTWPWSNGFIRSIPSTRRGYDPKADLQSVACRRPTAGKVVAELKFAFWQWMFTAGQDARLWEPHLRTAFPGADRGSTISACRASAFDKLKSVRTFRNRIAHHEPIFTRDLQTKYDRLHEMMSWRSGVAAEWMGRSEGVTALIAQKPLP